MGSITEKGKVYTYILRGKRDYYYCGITNDIDKRYKEHNTGKSKSTKRNLPYSLKFLQSFGTRQEARNKEVLIKKAGVRKWYMKNIEFGNHVNMVCTNLIGNQK